MKFIHVMNVDPGRFVRPFAEFVNQYLGDEHYFLPIGKKENVRAFSEDFRNVIKIFYPTKYSIFQALRFFKKVKRELNKANVILWHSLFYNPYFIFYISYQSSIISRSAWFVWGGDLYNWRRKGIFSQIINKRYLRLVRGLRGAVVLLPVDEKKLRETFKFTAPVYISNYVDQKVENMIKMIDKEPYKHNYFNVLVGHSAVNAINHKRSIEALSKYNSPDLRVYIPLSYGNMSYAKEIEEYAIQKLGRERVIFLHKYMSKVDYYRLLHRMDAAIFDTERQIGLGNIYVLMYFGCRIYLRKDSAMHEYFLEKDIKVHDCEELGIVPWTEFILKKDVVSVKIFAQELWNIEKLSQDWKIVFSELLKENKQKIVAKLELK